MSDRMGRARRFLSRARRSNPTSRPHEAAGAAEGWEATATPPAGRPTDRTQPPLSARVLALFGDPRIDGLSAATAARLLRVPADEAEATLEALASEGVLRRENDAVPRYLPTPDAKARLEDLFAQTAEALGEPVALALRSEPQAVAVVDDDEPRLPVTAGLLSLFLPGTGQLLNGDVGRASLVFAVWSLAWITHLAPIWSFVCLYAGAEAFFTAKIRGIERRLAREAAAKARHDAAAGRLPPEPTT